MLLFDSYGFTSLKVFIIQGNRKSINKVLHGVENSANHDLLEISISAYRSLRHAEILELSSKVADLFHLISKFAKVNNIKSEFTLYLVDDQL